MDQQVLTNLDAWQVLVVMVIPWVTGVINRVRWGSTTKFSVFIGVVIVSAAVETWLRGEFSAENWAVSALTFATLASGFYRLWKPAIKDVEEFTG